MTSSDDELRKPRYSPDDLKQLATILGVPNLSAEHTEQLQTDAVNYLIMKEIEPKKPGIEKAWLSWPRRSERRKAIREVAKAARKLKEALRDQTLLFLDDDQQPKFDTQSLDDLAEAADEAAGQIPRTGADPKHARPAFVSCLGQIFMEVIGKRPTLSRDRFGKPCGLFYEFVEAALGRLDQHAVQGVESDVKKVVARLARLEP